LQEADARLRVAREEQRCGLMSGKRAADVTMALLQLRGTSGSERQRVLSALDIVFLFRDVGIFCAYHVGN
jgi:hypothetical protein